MAAVQSQDEKQQAAPVPGAASSSEALFELDGVSFSIAGTRLIGPISLTLNEHRVIGLIGHNGSGKTTLLRLLSRQQPPSAGEVRFLGRSLMDWRDKTFARALAYMPQRPPAAGGLKVRELVAFGRYPWHGALGRFSAQDAVAVETAMERAEVTHFADRLVESLSGGERQRVWLAMLVAQEAQCLLLDEPISALDVAHQIKMMELVRDLSRKQGFSVVVVLHDVNMAARFCDEIVGLRDGQVLTRGSPEKLMSDETLEELYGIPMGIMRHPGNGAPVSFVW